MRSTVSIALCTYNGAKYLSSQLESYLSQTYLPDEAVICDDCSQDGTISILNSFATRAPFPVRILINDQNIGFTKNFEKAISLCSGDIIFLSDQDDVWSPNKIERMLKEFECDDEVGMVFSDAELVDESLQPQGRNLFDGRISLKEKEMLKNSDLFPILLDRNIVTGATLAFRAKYNNAIIPIPIDIPEMFHDGWIAVIVSILSRTVALEETLIKYRQHDEQQIGMDSRRYILMIYKLKWKNALGNTERKHKAKREYVEAIKNNVTSRIAVPKHCVDAMNMQILYQQEYANHYLFRKRLSEKRIMRLWPVTEELLRGRYHRFSNGVRSAARDLIVDHAKETEYHEIIDNRKPIID